MQTGTASDLQSSACLCHHGVKSMHHHAWLKTILLSVSVDCMVPYQSKTRSRVLGAKEMIQWEEQLCEREEQRSRHSTHLGKPGIVSCVSITSTLRGRQVGGWGLPASRGTTGSATLSERSSLKGLAETVTGQDTYVLPWSLSVCMGVHTLYTPTSTHTPLHNTKGESASLPNL